MSTTPTKHVEPLLSDFVTGKLPAEDRQSVEWHLLACERCRTGLRTVEEVLRSVRAEPPKPSPEYFASILPRVRERIAAQRPRRSPMLTAWTRLAAPLIATALVLSGIVLVSPRVERRLSPDRSIRPVVASLTDEELAEIVEAQSPPPVLGNVPGQELETALVTERLSGGDSVPLSLANTAGIETLSETEIEHLVHEIPDEQCDEVLARLKERTTP